MGWLFGRGGGEPPAESTIWDRAIESIAPSQAATEGSLPLPGEDGVLGTRELISLSGSRYLIHSTGSMLRQANSLPIIQRACALLAGSVVDAVESLRVVDSDSMQAVKDSTSQHAISLIRDSFDGRDPASVSITRMVQDFILCGNALVRIVPGAGMARPHIQTCHPIATARVEGSGELKFRVLPDGYEYASTQGHANTIDVDSDELAIARWTGGSSRMMGLQSLYFATPPIESVARSVLLQIGARDFVLQFFGRDGSAKNDLAITLESDLDTESQKSFFRYIRRFTTGRGPLVLPGRGAKVTRLDRTAQDAQLTELRDAELKTLAMVYGLPIHLLGGVDNSGAVWNSSLSQATHSYLRFTVRPLIQTLLAPIGHRLLRRGTRFETDPLRGYRGDAEAISRIVDATKGEGDKPILTRDELRGLLGKYEDYKDSSSNEGQPMRVQS